MASLVGEREVLLISNLQRGTQERGISGKYREFFLRRFSGIYVFQNYLRSLINFSRFGTEEERR